MAPPEIHSYLDYRAFLRDWFQYKKTVNPRYSHRVFARRANQSSPSVLLNVIAGRRDLTPATRAGFVVAMGLSSSEADFFRRLVDLDQARGPEDRAVAMERIRDSLATSDHAWRVTLMVPPVDRAQLELEVEAVRARLASLCAAGVTARLDPIQ